MFNLFQNYDLYKKGKITGGEFAVILLKDSGKAAAVSAGVTGGIILGSAVCKHLATSTSVVARTTGNVMGKVLGPAVMVAAVGYQVSIGVCQGSPKKFVSSYYEQRPML